MDKDLFIKENMQVHGGERDFWEYMFRVLDTNQNGKLDFKEFIVSLSIGTKGTAEEKLVCKSSYFGTLEHTIM